MTFHWATWHEQTASFFLEDYDNREVLNKGAVCCKDVLIIFKQAAHKRTVKGYTSFRNAAGKGLSFRGKQERVREFPLLSILIFS